MTHYLLPPQPEHEEIGKRGICIYCLSYYEIMAARDTLLLSNEWMSPRVRREPYTVTILFSLRWFLFPI